MNTIAALVEHHAAATPDAPALFAPGRPPLAYAGLAEQATETRFALAAAGVGRGDRVAIVLPNGPEMASAFLSVAACAASAPLNPAYRRQEHEFYLADLDAAALLVLDGSDSPAVEVARERGIPVLDLVPGRRAGRFRLHRNGRPLSGAAPGAVAGPDDAALILHTSGTTSRPKMVPLTQTNVVSSARHIVATLGLEPADRCLNIMPLFHIHGLIAAVLASVTAGASIVATPGFDAPRFFDWLDDHQPTWTTAVPTMHQAILARADRHREVLERRPLRFVRSSSASLPPQVMAQLERVFSAPVVEAYGMTEAAHQMACNPLPPRDRKPGSVGPAAGPEVAVAGEEDGHLLPAGERGEVVIRGPNVTNGYEANPDANAGAFRDGWFRTGDQGYLDEDGYLFLTGRLKEMINRAGENISPREIDEVLLDHPAVAQAVAFAMPDPTVGEEVAAAIVLAEGAEVDERQLWAFASTRLADFKLPRRFVFLDAIPKGPTGKLQRIGLADKLGLTSDTAADVAGREPETEEEKAIAAIAAELLEVDRVGLDDDFFSLGGDSIVATRLVQRAGEILGRTLPPYAFFRRPTVAGLLEFAEEAGDPVATLAPCGLAPGEPVPPTAAQEMLWVAERLAPDTLAHHRAGAIRIEGPLEIDGLRGALSEVVRRHDALRARLPVDGSRPRFVVDDATSIPLEFLEASGVDGFLRRPFDLAGGPLARFALVREESEVHRLLVDVHHAVFDAWSMSVLARELASLDAGESRAAPAAGYRDYIVRQRALEDGGPVESDVTWWKDRLGGASRLPLPIRAGADRDSVDERGGAASIRIPVEVARALDARGRTTGLTSFATHLAVFDRLLARWCGTDEVVVGAPVAGRDLPGTEDLLGLFINYVVLRTDLSGGPDLDETFRRVREVVRDAIAHQAAPYPHVSRALRPAVRIGRNPLFDVLFQRKPFPLLRRETGPRRWIQEEIDPGTAHFDLSVELIEDPGGVTGRIEYRRSLFEREAICDLASAWDREIRTVAG